MSDSQTILCGFDGSDAAINAALTAIRLAAGTNSEVELFRVELPHDDGITVPDTLSDDATRHGVALSIVGARDLDVIAALAERIARDPPALLVLGDRGRSELRHLLIGRTTTGMVRLDLLPVLICRSETDRVIDGGFHNLLVPVDLSEASAAALRYAEAIRFEGGSIEVQHVIDSQLAPPYFPDSWSQLKQADAQGPLAEFVDRHTDRAAPTCRVDTGRPHEEIVRAAWARNHDLIVMSRSGAGALERMLVGSVTELVIANAPGPVLVLPTGASDGADSKAPARAAS